MVRRFLSSVALLVLLWGCGALLGSALRVGAPSAVLEPPHTPEPAPVACSTERTASDGAAARSVDESAPLGEHIADLDRLMAVLQSQRWVEPLRGHEREAPGLALGERAAPGEPLLASK